MTGIGSNGPQSTDSEPETRPLSPVRYGIVGTGMMGIEHIENVNMLPDGIVTAVADPDGSSLATAAEAARVLPDGSQVATFTAHEELLASGLCDAIVIASPNFTHFRIVEDVLRSGLHALIEKPMCITTAECEALIRLADETEAGNEERTLSVGLEYRYMPAVAQLIREVHDGAVGTPRMVTIREHRFPFLTKVGNWNRFSENTGGTLVEKCCHFFDLMNLIIRERPQSVMASGGQDVNHLDEHYEGRTPDILDNAYVIVDYPSGARAMLDLCMFAEATHNQEEVSVVGERGKIEALIPEGLIRRGRRGEHWIGRVESEVVKDQEVGHVGLHHGSSYVEHLRFCSAIRGGHAVDVSLDDGLWSVAIGEAAHKSIDEGRPVAIEEVLSMEVQR